MTVKDINQHKSNSGVATEATIDEIKTFKFRKGKGHRAKGGPGKTCQMWTVSPTKRMPSMGQEL